MLARSLFAARSSPSGATPAVVGRDSLAKQIAASLDAGSLVTLHGAPGVGTSTVARLALSLRPDLRVVHVEARGGSSSLFAKFAAALGLRLGALDPRLALARACEALDTVATVVLFDDASGNVDAVGALAADVLSATQRARVLVCSQRATQASNERLIEVAPLSIEDSVALLRARLASRSLSAAEALSDEVALALVAQADGLALAIELIAARVSLVGAAAALDVSLGRERGERRATDALDRALDEALVRLASESDALIVALSALCVCEGAFDRSTAHSVMGLRSARAADEALSSLVASSLVRVQHDQRGARFSVLASIRQRILRSIDVEAARVRHAERFADRSASDEHARENLLAAWRWALGDERERGEFEGSRSSELCSNRGDFLARDESLALALAAKLEPVLLVEGPASLHRAVVERTIAACSSSDRRVVQLQLSLAKGEAICGRYRSAIDAVEAALVRAEREGDEEQIGWCAAISSYALAAVGERESARRFAERARRAAEATRSLLLASQAAQVLASVALDQQDVAAAEDGYRRALALARRASSPRAVAIGQANLARAAQARGAHDEALRLLTEAERAFVALQDRAHVARVRVHREAVRVALGERGRDASLRLALEDAIAQGHCVAELEAREALVRCASLEGRAELAVEELALLEAAVLFGDDQRWRDRVEGLRVELRRARDVEQDGFALSSSEDQRELDRTNHTAIGDGCDREPRAHRARVLAISRDGARVVWRELDLDFSRRGPLRRVLLALASAHERAESLSSSALREAGWPGERMLPESAAARVYMAVRRLRACGLASLIRTSDEGYALDRATQLRWIDSPL